MNSIRFPLSTARRRQHERWLHELTALPTVAGHETRVISWVTRWIRQRPQLTLKTDAAGNLIITTSGRKRPHGARPLFFTAHLDHPGFVLHKVLHEHDVELEFRGGVWPQYFVDASLHIFDRRGRPHRATVYRFDADATPFPLALARTQQPTHALRPGDIGRWALGEDFPLPRTAAGRFHAYACDDLAGVAAALAALDVLSKGSARCSAGVLLTRAEEIGFVGAIEACRQRTVPRDSRLICLETSRSFADSPMGAGPIVRVGDRTAVFSAELTNRLCAIAARHAERRAGFVWQRKLMIGGTCEATAFNAYGYDATCLCVALGNYHNMVDIDGVERGGPARVGPEIIAIEDYHGLIELLVQAARTLDTPAAPIRERMDALLERHRAVLATH